MLVNWLCLRIILLLSLNFVFVDLASFAADLKKQTEKDVFDGLKLFSESMALVKKRCLRNIDMKLVVEDALKSALSKIDPHSSFINNYEQVSDSIAGNFSGIGVSILNKNNEDEHLLIIDVLDDSPAQKAGLLAGDKILEVEGQKLRGLSCDEVLSKVRGKRGSKSKLKILRNKKIIDFEVLRDTISDCSSLGYYFDSHKIYYVGLKTFSENAPKQMKALIDTVNNNKDCKGLVLDLRANPGGVMESAIDIASLFIPKKSLVVCTKNKFNVLNDEYFTHQEPVLKKEILIFILINNFTASAAEILAGALRYHAEVLDRQNKKNKLLVFLLGTTTFGKGSVQEVVPLSGKSALKLTSMLYFLPDGSSIQAKGVKPDFVMLPMRSITTEERFLNELYGQEKSMLHHITRTEVDAITNGVTPENHSELDKKTQQKVQALEDEKNKVEANEKEVREFKALDVGDLIEEVAVRSKEDAPDHEFATGNLELKRQAALSRDFYVQSAINMISYLSLLRKYEPERVSSLQLCKTALKETMAFEDSIKMQKLK